jgi:cupin fold WbuC family metalloprotein
MILIDRKLVSNLSARARASARLRRNHNFHQDYADPTNRMLNAMEPGTYVRPHRHEAPDKWEAFILLSGRALVVTFDDSGNAVAHAVLDGGAGVFGVEIPARVWHSVAALASGTVLYEIKPGPYAPLDDKDFAPWAPAEGAPEAARYLAGLTAGYAGVNRRETSSPKSGRRGETSRSDPQKRPVRM